MALEEAFIAFCAFGAGGNAKAELDGSKFGKLCKDTKLVDKKFTATDVDLLFSKIKPKGGRTIDFATFRDGALPEIAKKKGVELEAVQATVISSGPAARATVPDQVALHDDKENYTGVYAKGGPSTVDTGTSDLSQITNRKDADVRGVQSGHQRTSVPRAAAPRASTGQAGQAPASPARLNPLLHRLDGAVIAQALESLEGWESKGIPCLEEAIAQLRAAQSGGARKSEGAVSQPHPPAAAAPPDRKRSQGAPSEGKRKSAGGATGGMVSGDGAVDWGAVQEVFNAFCAFGAGKGTELEGAKFAKFCKEAGLIDKSFTATDADLVFSKVKPKGGRTIDFGTFKSGALPEIATRKKCTVEQVVASMKGGPKSSGTVADSVALHDDKENYTGVYAQGGPSTVDTGTSDLSQITNRKDADVRGVQR